VRKGSPWKLAKREGFCGGGTLQGKPSLGWEVDVGGGEGPHKEGTYEKKYRGNLVRGIKEYTWGNLRGLKKRWGMKGKKLKSFLRNKNFRGGKI